MSEKWQTVKSDRKGRKDASQHEKNKDSSRSIGLQQSSAAFSQWSALEQSREASSGGNEVVQEDNDGGKGREEGGRAGREGVKHHIRAKKEKRVKTSFDEVVGELDAAYLIEYVENLKNDNTESPLVWMKDMTSYIQLQFKDVQPETDHTFSNRDPAYPASALPASLHSQLVSHLRSCPLLALESLFRHCLDCLLGEVKGGLPSYGTRLIIQLIRDARPQVCTAVSERIHLLLQSCGTKVPETLSLLWAGLPHPKSLSHISLVAWQYLCLPFLYRVKSPPKQVLSYCLNYTCLLLRHLVTEENRPLSKCLPPETLCAVLSSPTVVSRRAHGNVQDLCQFLQDHLLSNENIIVDYFSACFVQLGLTQNCQLLMDFTISCLCESTSCLSCWRRLAPSHIVSSQLLLTHLAQHWAVLATRLQPAPLNTTLSHLATSITVNEHRQLCQDLLGRLPSVKANVTRESRKNGCGTTLCRLLMVTAIAVYLGILAVFLVHVATHGPELEAKLLSKIMSPSEWRSLLDQATQLMWQSIVWFLNLLD